MRILLLFLISGLLFTYSCKNDKDDFESNGSEDEIPNENVQFEPLKNGVYLGGTKSKTQPILTFVMQSNEGDYFHFEDLPSPIANSCFIINDTLVIFDPAMERNTRSYGSFFYKMNQNDNDLQLTYLYSTDVYQDDSVVVFNEALFAHDLALTIERKKDLIQLFNHQIEVFINFEAELSDTM